MAMTLRLTDDEEKALITIKDSLGCSTLTATIKSLITLHAELTQNLGEKLQAADVAIVERDAIKEELSNYLTAQNNLTKMVLPEWHDEVVSRLKAHEQGCSETYSREEVKVKLKEHLNALRD